MQEFYLDLQRIKAQGIEKTALDWLTIYRECTDLSISQINTIRAHRLHQTILPFFNMLHTYQQNGFFNRYTPSQFLAIHTGSEIRDLLRSPIRHEYFGKQAEGFVNQIYLTVQFYNDLLYLPDDYQTTLTSELDPQCYACPLVTRLHCYESLPDMEDMIPTDDCLAMDEFTRYGFQTLWIEYTQLTNFTVITSLGTTLSEVRRYCLDLLAKPIDFTSLQTF